MQVRTVPFVESCGSLKGGKPMPRARAVAAMITMIVLAISGFTPCALAQIPCSYEVAAIIQGPPGPIHQSPTFATAISPDGRYVVGYFNFDAVGSNRAFCYDMKTSEFRILPLIEGTFTNTAWDVNNAGIVVGEIGGASGHWGFLFDFVTSEYTLLPSLAGVGICRVTGINEAGTVCGTRTIAGPPNYPETAFIWSQRDGFTDLGLINGFGTTASDINNFGVVTGNMAVRNVLHPFAWNGSEVTDLGTTAGFNTRGEAINDTNVVAGYGNLAPGFGVPVRGFAGDASPLNDIGTLPGYERSFLVAINNAGLAVGECTAMGSSAATGILWDGVRLRDIQTMLIDPGEVDLYSATAIDESGRVTCVADVALAVIALVLEPVFVQGDVTGDCAVELADLLIVIRDWGKSGSPADVTGDGVVNVSDLLMVIANWTG